MWPSIAIGEGFQLADFSERVESASPRLTKSQKVLAAYLLAHRNELAFETASSVGRKVGVSSMTVGRFARELGYDNFAALQRATHAVPSQSRWLVDNRYSAFVAHQKDYAHLNDSLELEVEAIRKTYALVGTPTWRACIDLLAESEVLFVAGFIGLRGIAMHFANHLNIVRDDARFAPGDNGTFAEVFLSGAKTRCLVIIDVRRYSSQARLLAARAEAEQVPLIVITDPYCYWARDHTDKVLTATTDTNLFWDSTAALNCLLGLLVHDVVERVRPVVGERLKTMIPLQDEFGGFED